MSKRSGYIIILLLLLVIGAERCAFGKQGSSEANQVAAPTLTPTEKPISDLTYQVIRIKRKALTDAQWDEYRKELLGLRVQWSGWVEEVKSNGEIQVDMDSPNTVFSTADVYIRVPASEATKYNLDQKIKFVGDIQSVTSFFDNPDITLTNITVLE